MFTALRGYVWSPSGTETAVAQRLDQLDIVGYKACGLALFPPQWTPPFLVLTAELYKAWKVLGEDDRELLLNTAAADIEHSIASWVERWPHGLAFRSSATSETLQDRGAYQSVELTADYSSRRIKTAITDIFTSFAALEGEGAIAVIVQARLLLGRRGHLSNERRVSKTVNQWMWEQELPGQDSGRMNSQRSMPPPAGSRILLQPSDNQTVVHALQRIGRWCTGLSLGPVHVEWGVAGVHVWLFQIDVEDDQPDSGYDPEKFLRTSDAAPAGIPPAGCPFRVAELLNSSCWPKIDKVRDLKRGRTSPYPQLCYATGAEIESAISAGRDIRSDIAAITNDHAVCRTDCVTQGVDRLNLPRTETVSATAVVDFMINTLADLKRKGAESAEICFILHKFIPSRAAAWAMADPNRQIVLVDALWGLPDGLQYLTHDRFEYDVKLRALSSETVRYKPYFLQEAEDGSWKRISVKRKLARHKAISSSSIREIAEHTHSVASNLGEAVQIMWFCDVDPMALAGDNIPWFMQSAEAQSPSRQQTIPEAAERRTITSTAQLQSESFQDCVLELEPEAELFRDSKFLDTVARVALEHNLPVVIRGSTLSHAYYTLRRKGVFVVATETSRTRARQRQIFNKLVRDEIPARIIEKGERVSVAKIAQSQSREALVIKLHEEAQELLSAARPEDVTAELADLLEVLRALCAATGTEFESVERAAESKRKARGSFAQNVVLLETSWPAWKERPAEEAGATIDLATLAHIENHGRSHTANFTAVLGGHEAKIELTTGAVIKIRLTGRGVEVAEDETEDNSSNQMSFQFDK